jgi:hypothetical protein
MTSPIETMPRRHGGGPDARQATGCAPDSLGALRAATAAQRRFLGMPEDERTELTFFVEGRISVAHATTLEHHVRLLAEGQRARNFNGAYQLVNGPIIQEIFARYEPNRIQRAWNGRVADSHIESLRAVFLDCDAKRIKGISSTDSEKSAALAVAGSVIDYLAEFTGHDCIGRGDSGNGAFVLIAIIPTAPTDRTKLGIDRLLAYLNRKFGTEQVKIDSSVSNPARLMPCAGTMKRKGWNTPERPHRMTSFTCSESVKRIPLEELVGPLS